MMRMMRVDEDYHDYDVTGAADASREGSSHVCDLPGSREECGAAAVQTHVSVLGMRAA